ncbi:MAG: hypothetical protein ACTH8F_08410 [Microbacterium sp.]|uniref:hypothetical protein n=1 Tax=Microbacterium sp. TaxID=51671 RepID=UPI003F945ED7
MTTKTNTRPTGAIARILDADALLAKGRDAYVRTYQDANPADLQPGPLPQMILAVDRGNPAIVNGEGVGSIATEEDLIEVYFSNGFSIFPLELTLTDVAHAVSDDTIDLADGIRTFGGRLDANHHRWYSRYDHNHRP